MLKIIKYAGCSQNNDPQYLLNNINMDKLRLKIGNIAKLYCYSSYNPKTEYYTKRGKFDNKAAMRVYGNRIVNSVIYDEKEGYVNIVLNTVIKKEKEKQYEN